MKLKFYLLLIVVLFACTFNCRVLRLNWCCALLRGGNIDKEPDCEEQFPNLMEDCGMRGRSNNPNGPPAYVPRRQRTNNPNGPPAYVPANDAGDYGAVDEESSPRGNRRNSRGSPRRRNSRGNSRSPQRSNRNSGNFGRQRNSFDEF
eukprot:TRINITY_DN10799_c0_g1_i1.p1 TRINITY_DN10799_c0_g1~~TRINITY_DN10799_c0_g1_i1.p1  ORF type:complete len:147 (-),score=32.89 TRINITY_DN10799_c0_g1_i1:130-570(-)